MTARESTIWVLVGATLFSVALWVDVPDTAPAHRFVALSTLSGFVIMVDAFGRMWR